MRKTDQHEKVVSLDPKRRNRRSGRQPRRPLRVMHRPPDNMPAGSYIAKCIEAILLQRGRDPSAQLVFEVGDGEFKGVHLLGWINLRKDGWLTPESKYYAAARIALGHDPKPGQSVEPEDIFPGNWFSVEAGFRRTTDNAEKPDFLRVHRILEKLNQ